MTPVQVRAIETAMLVFAHGNSLRSIVMYIENLTKDEVLNLEIPTGKPLFYSYDNYNRKNKLYNLLKTNCTFYFPHTLFKY